MQYRLLFVRGSNLIDKRFSIEDSQTIFERIFQTNVFDWTSSLLIVCLPLYTKQFFRELVAGPKLSW